MLNYCSKSKTAFRELGVTTVVFGAVIAITIITRISVQGAK